MFSPSRVCGALPRRGVSECVSERASDLESVTGGGKEGLSEQVIELLGQ